MISERSRLLSEVGPATATATGTGRSNSDANETRGEYVEKSKYGRNDGWGGSGKYGSV